MSESEGISQKETVKVIIELIIKSNEYTALNIN